MMERQDESVPKNPEELKDNGIGSFKNDWKNKPLLEHIKADIFNAANINAGYIANIEKGLDTLRGEIPAEIKARMRANQSKTSPKIADAQAKWMYPKISEPFHSASSLFSITAINAYSSEYALQAERLLNYHFKYSINRRFLVDQATKQFYDHGVVFAKVYWESEEVEEEVLKLVPVYDNTGSLVKNEHKLVKETFLTVNKPCITLCQYNSIIIDPSCKGDLSKAKFIAHKYSACKADLLKDSRYENLDYISYERSVDGLDTVIGDSDVSTNHLNNIDSMQFEDEARRSFTVTEYWGMFDIHGTGLLTPVVVAFVGDVIIRMDASPMPDNKLPFVSAAYDVEEFSVYGANNSLSIREDQQIIGNVTRALIDQVSDRMSRRTVIHPNQFKNAREKRNFLNNQPAESSGTIDPRIGIFTDFNDKPIDMNLLNVLSLFKNSVQEQTGVSSMGANSNSFTSSNEVDAYVDAASNRESTVLGRFAKFWSDIGEKFIALSLHLMEDEEIEVITGSPVVPYPLEIPRTISPYSMDVQVMTEGVKRAKIAKLLEILQFVKDSPDARIMGDIVRKICLLDDSPDLAQTIHDIITAPPPEPTPEEIMLMQLQIEEARYKVEVLKFTAADLMATAQLKSSRVGTEESKQKLQYAKADDINNSLLEKSTGMDLGRERAKKQIELEADSVRAKILSDLGIQEDAQKKANELVLQSTLDPTKRSSI